ncbi:hypothetical protein [Rhodomicrobium vannielii]|uniref:hypothetical protein n=1 Tax=Rhodomicrobium vannielii TaxID=1069 RepID=UPI001FDA27F6|nr:hypothetical protein [Rhodomicrobium vannielii]
MSKVDGAALWANMHLLFWLSLIPFATAWMGENHFEKLPTALYGIALLMPSIAYHPRTRDFAARKEGFDAGARSRPRRERQGVHGRLRCGGRSCVP